METREDIKGICITECCRFLETRRLKRLNQRIGKKAREHHPDKGGCSETFDKVQKAFETLSCPKKREQYDRLQHVAISVHTGRDAKERSEERIYCWTISPD